MSDIVYLSQNIVTFKLLSIVYYYYIKLKQNEKKNKQKK